MPDSASPADRRHDKLEQLIAAAQKHPPVRTAIAHPCDAASLAAAAEAAQLRLIEPIEISLRFDSAERLTLQGLYTVSLDRLRDIDDAAALRLFRAGHLQLAYSMAASLKHIPRLARLRERRQAIG